MQATLHSGSTVLGLFQSTATTVLPKCNVALACNFNTLHEGPRNISECYLDLARLARNLQFVKQRVCIPNTLLRTKWCTRTSCAIKYAILFEWDPNSKINTPDNGRIYNSNGLMR